MPPRFIAFFAVLTTVIFAVHGYLGWRLVGPSGLTGIARALAWGAVVAYALLLLFTFTARFMLPKGNVADVVSWVGFTAMGLFSFVLTFTVLRDLGWLIAKAASTLPADPVRRQSLLHLTNLVVLGGSSALVGLGVMGARRRAAVVDVVVPIKDLPAALEGFTIVQLTDIHVGPTIKKGYIDAIVDGVNELDADMVAITGDVVDGSVLDLGAHTAPLGRLKGKHGVFFCTGNHEYYSGCDEWCAEFARLGLQPLMNAHVVVNHGGEDVVVAGVTDFNAGAVIPEHTSDPQRAIQGAPSSSKLKILLAHQPRSVFAAVDCGYDLQLSGHTHGGQFFPWIFMVRLQQPFNAGLTRMKDLWIYTSRGTGYWGPPVRVGAPSEITRLRMTRAV
ncbi:MAG: metallophosphoesterase [Deltaproteobacteria bacterium]|nr:metallophosphoesterase [Deltaproteobacteria bacterium]